MRMRRRLIGLFALLPLFCAAAIEFPELTGRVVDNAGMLSPATEQALTEQLAALEQATTNQLVVVTLPDLQGYTIEDFGYQLGRHWGIGQKGKDNGVVLLVAKAERKVRIDVGYGLEGQLTDALSANIIHSVILPYFKKGDFEGGITQGVAAITGVFSDQSTYVERPRGEEPPMIPFFIFWVIFVFFIIFANIRKGSRRTIFGGGGGFRSGGGGGGFRGGGGSFGGGGASGGW
ncbi:MAG TPA: TPM domain-containing protein [Gammaproteobacteria bacterium]|nr:TPM domain-containing protein [Gammaproteobacteria bacterium]